MAFAELTVRGLGYGLSEPLRQAFLARDPEQVRGVPELAGLTGESLQQMRMRMAETRYGYPGAKIEIAFSIRIPEVGSFGSDHRDRIDLSLIRPGIESVFFIEVHDFFCCEVVKIKKGF